MSINFSALTLNDALDDTPRIDDSFDSDQVAWMDDLLADNSDDLPVADELYKVLTPLEMLALTFSSPGAGLESTQIQALLVEYNYDLDAVFEALTNAPNSVKSTPMPAVKQVCRFWLSGSCLRSDCQFSHDVANRICKYFLMGSCSKGEQCPFTHTTTPAPKQAPPPPVQKTLTSDDFPSLTKSSAKPITPLLPAKFSQTVSKNLASMPPPPRPSIAAPPSTNYSKGRKKETLELTDIKWTDTGGHVAQLYKSTREEAIAAAKQRNRYFELAKAAYLKGDGAASRKYSNLAREQNEIMSKLHAQAAEAIFSARNDPKSTVIDVHGLHVDEAIHFVTKRMRTLPSGGKLQVIAGTGNHSSRTTRVGAKILPELQGWCDESGYRWKEATLKDGRGGVLLIYK
jgi:hypothetical protein